MTTAAQLWDELGATTGQEPGWHARRVADASGAGILVAIRKPDGVLALLAELRATAVPPTAEYPVAQGFEVFPEPIDPGPRGRVRLCLILTNNRFRDVFSVLVDDIIENLRDCPREEDVVRRMIARLHVWQVFMRRHGPGQLDADAQTGLAAELIFLRDRVLDRVPAVAAIRGWKGPCGGCQDFVLSTVAVEIKGSTASSQDEIQISSLEQLDAEQTRTPIVLCRVSLSRGGSGSESLPEIVHELRARLLREDAIAKGVFEDRLLDAGYLDAHADHYGHLRYTVRRMDFYQVHDAFPRIGRGDVRQGVLSCSYIIQLSDCGAFEIGGAEVDDLIKGGGP
jgi:Putative  PD-(D/E)XK family member, (DUF4420)